MADTTIPNWTELYKDPTSARAALTQIQNEIDRRGGAQSAPGFEAQRQSLSQYITALENPQYWTINADGTTTQKPGTTLPAPGTPAVLPPPGQPTTEPPPPTPPTGSTAPTADASKGSTTSPSMPNWTTLYKDPTSARAALTGIENEIKRRGGATAAPNFEAQRVSLSQYITALENPDYWTINSDGTTTAKQPTPGTPSNPGGTPAPGTPTNPPTSPTPSTDTINPNASGLSAEDQAALARVKALLGQGENMGRQLAKEFYSDGSLGRLDPSLSSQETDALARLKEIAGSAGSQSQDVTDLLTRLKGTADQSGQLTSLEEEALGVARGALAGLSAPQIQALREAAHEKIAASFQQQARQLAKVQAAGGTYGAVAGAQQRLLGRDAVQQNRNLERDLLIQDIQEKDAARQQFVNLATATQGARDSRTNNSNSMLSSTVLGDQNNRLNAQNQAGSNYANFAGATGNAQRSVGEFNINQAAAEKAGQLGAIFGGMGTVTNQRGLIAGEDYANTALQEQIASQDKMLKLIADALKKQGIALNG